MHRVGMSKCGVVCLITTVLLFLPSLAARPVLGPEKSGLAFRMLWFETADDNQPAAVTRFVFPAGTDYPSQKIRATLPILPGARVSKDDQGNVSMDYAEAIPVKPGRPLLMGFVADVSFLGPAYQELDPKNVSWKKRIPRTIKQLHLIDEPEFDLSDPGIQKVVKELVRGRPTPVTLMNRIWTHVNQHMEADLPLRCHRTPDRRDCHGYWLTAF